MKVFNTPNIRNITLLGHAGSGKTTLAECMLFEGGEISRRGSTSGQNTVSDYHELEHERNNSIFSTLMHVHWKDSKINIIDTPGYDDFVGEIIASLRVADTGVMVLNATQGVEVGTEIIWENTEKFQIPMIFVINQVDSEKADFEKTFEQATSRFGSKVRLVQYPYNQGENFDAIIDVLKMVMYKFPENGSKPEKLPIPDEEKEKADRLHNELVEAIAENDDGLMELFFEKGTLSEEEMTKGLKLSMINHDIFPVFCCSAERNMGSGRVMGFLNDIAPSSHDMPPAERKSGKTLTCDPDGDTVLFIYKTISEPHLGDMSFFKVYSGTVKGGDELVNAVTRNTERLTQLYVMNGKKREAVEMLKAGDIGATVKLKSSHTNNTLHEKNKEYNIAPIEFPEPRISMSVYTESKSDMEKLGLALHQLHEEDPSIILENSKELKQLIVHGQGEMHLAMAKWKVEHNAKIKMKFGEPKIPYRETIRKAVKTNYRHKKQSGGSGQFGEVYMLVEPYYEGMPAPDGINVRRVEEHDLPWGGKLVFNNCIVGGAIDAKYMPSIVKGIMQRMEDGPLTGSYSRDIRVSVYDGKMHPVDSNDMAFQIAGAIAFKQAFLEASPQLMEPVYDVEVMVPDEIMGDVMGDLQTRRGVVEGMEAAPPYQIIKAKVPLAELHKYASTLRSISQGRAKHKQRFAEYAAVPHDVQQSLVKERESAEATG